MAMDIDTHIMTLQDQVLRLISEEENLRELKKEAAGDFRRRIDEIKHKRIAAMKDLADLKKKDLTTEGTTLIKSSNINKLTVQ